MKRLLKFPVDQNNTILIEVDEPEAASGTVRAGRPGEVIEQVHRTFSDTLSTIKPVAEAIVTNLRNLNDSPDEFTVQFGLKLSAGAELFITASAEANFDVTLTWKHQHDNDDS
jgi:hypothetical protein